MSKQTQALERSKQLFMSYLSADQLADFNTKATIKLYGSDSNDLYYLFIQPNIMARLVWKPIWNDQMQYFCTLPTHQFVFYDLCLNLKIMIENWEYRFLERANDSIGSRKYAEPYIDRV